MKVHLQYGRDGLDVEIPGTNVTVIEPRFVPGLPDEAAAFREAVRRPIGAPPLREVVKAARPRGGRHPRPHAPAAVRPAAAVAVRGARPRPAPSAS